MTVFDLIRQRLGTPAFEDENILLYCGDSTDLMKQLDRDLIPLTVTSPPYNIGKEYEKVRALDEYLDWMAEWIAQIHHLTSSNGAFWLNLGYLSIPEKAKAIPIPYLIWDRVPFYLIQEVVWNYGAGVAGRKFLSPRNEKFLWYVKDAENYTFNLDDIRDPDVKYPNQKKKGKLKCNPIGKNPSDVWQIPKVTSGADRASAERTEHPAQFPIALITRIILASSNVGELVFDPFVGSGSVLEAALRQGRRAVGFEISPNYVDLAIQRIEKTKIQMQSSADQPTFFDSPSFHNRNQF